MMTKTKALVFSLGAPLLYYLMNIIAMMAVAVYYTAKALSGTELPTDHVEILEFSVAVMEDVLAATLPIMLASCLLFLLVMALAHLRKPVKLLEAVGLTGGVSVRTIILAVLAGMAFNFACQGFIEAIPVPQSWQETHDAVSASLLDESNMLFSLLMVSFLIPFTEEIVFRGFTQRILHHAFLPWSAVIIQGVIFGVFHANALQTIYACATGIIIGYIYMKTRNLWASVAFHMAYNGVNFIVYYIAELANLNVDDAAEPGIWVLALMAAGGATLTLLFVRSIEGRQKEME